jgi:hypothetical protein
MLLTYKVSQAENSSSRDGPSVSTSSAPNAAQYKETDAKSAQYAEAPETVLETGGLVARQNVPQIPSVDTANVGSRMEGGDNALLPSRDSSLAVTTLSSTGVRFV